MPRKSKIDQEKLELAVTFLTWAPKMTVHQAMLAAEFSSEDANNKVLQRKVARTLPNGSKGELKTSVTESVPVSAVDIDNNTMSDVSPITDDSGLAEISDENLLSPPRKLKKLRLNSRQAKK